MPIRQAITSAFLSRDMPGCPGETRFNNEIGYLEVYNSTDWIPALGTSGAASEETIQETMNLWSLILG